jgi:hypothetical protein
MHETASGCMKEFRSVLWVVMFILASCGKPAQPGAVLATIVPAAATLFPTATSIPATVTSAPPTETSSPLPTRDLAIFGSIGSNEIQAFALEPVANAIFVRAMDAFVASSSVQEYQVTSVTIFPGGGGLLAEIIYNVRTNDSTWLSDGGTQSADSWINGNCSRFDFFTTDTEYQLKNKRLCG